jgi:hypothetical protein
MFSTQELIKIYQETMKITKSIKNNPGTSTIYYKDVVEKYMSTMSGEVPRIIVRNDDTLDTMLHLRAMGFKTPVILNMASDRWPGGGVRSGEVAQEECICRRSTLLPLLECLKNKYNYDLYPFAPLDEWNLMQNEEKFNRYCAMPEEAKKYNGKDVAIHTRNVILLRDSNYRILRNEDRVQFDVITVAGIRYPELVGGKLKANDEKILRMKIRQIMAIANLQGHDSIVLGALGCGAFLNPPEQVAAIFREELSIIACKSVKLIVFAVLSKGKCKNYEIFSRVLGSMGQ